MDRTAHFSWFAALLGGGLLLAACDRSSGDTRPEKALADAPPLSLPAQSRAAEPRPKADAPPESADESSDPSAPNGRRASTTQPERRKRAAGQDGAGAPARGGDHGPEPVTAQGADLKVTRFVISRAVTGREPVGAATSFAAGEIDRLYAFVELANESKIATDIFVIFIPPDGGPPNRVKLDVGREARWRTWAFTRRPKAVGTWTAVVKTGDGRVLSRTRFDVTK